MSDAELSQASPVPLSQHSCALLARHRAMRAGRRRDVSLPPPAGEELRIRRRHMKMAVPWVLRNSTPEEEAELRATAPRLLGIIQDRVWEPRFARVMAPLSGATCD